MIDGDPDLVADLGARLARSGISTAQTSSCAAIHISATHRASAIVVAQRLSNDELANERVVSDGATAATLVESWIRTDLDATVFAVHATAPPVVMGGDASSATTRWEAPRASLQAFSAFEASFADDRTGWLGVVVGACVPLGTICVSARGRFAAVAEGPAKWARRERHAEDALFGGDVPRRIGATTVTLGFGAGMGATHTGITAPAGMRGSETFGLRADAHIAWVVPLRDGLALDLSASVDVAQVTDVETSGSPGLANEPRVLGRLGAGLRYGGP